MKEETGPAIKDDFHSINNLLNKITAQAGITRYHLEENSVNSEKTEEEKARLIKVMSDMEENALKIGDILKKLHKNIA